MRTPEDIVNHEILCCVSGLVSTPLPPRTADTMSDVIALASPSGRMSKRALVAAQKRISIALFGPGGMPRPGLRPQPTKAESLRREAANLRDLAARGMRPRAFNKQADWCEAEAARLDLDSKREG